MASPRQILDEQDAGPDPFQLFERWYAEAQTVGMVEPAAMALATATPAGIPSVRIVLLRNFDRRGFSFFTNYLSRKGEELQANPRAALAFYWAELERQVRVEGPVERVSDEESDAYFHARPIGHRLNALASPQSQVIASRDTLEQRMAELAEQYPHHQVSRRHIGAAIASFRKPSNSGRDAKIESMIACVIAACRTPAGCANDWLPNPEIDLATGGGVSVGVSPVSPLIR